MGVPVQSFTVFPNVSVGNNQQYKNLKLARDRKLDLKHNSGNIKMDISKAIYNNYDSYKKIGDILPSIDHKIQGSKEELYSYQNPRNISYTRSYKSIAPKNHNQSYQNGDYLYSSDNLTSTIKYNDRPVSLNRHVFYDDIHKKTTDFRGPATGYEYHNSVPQKPSHISSITGNTLKRNISLYDFSTDYNSNAMHNNRSYSYNPNNIRGQIDLSQQYIEPQSKIYYQTDSVENQKYIINRNITPNHRPEPITNMPKRSHSYTNPVAARPTNHLVYRVPSYDHNQSQIYNQVKGFEHSLKQSYYPLVNRNDSILLQNKYKTQTEYKTNYIPPKSYPVQPDIYNSEIVNNININKDDSTSYIASTVQFSEPSNPLKEYNNKFTTDQSNYNVLKSNYKTSNGLDILDNLNTSLSNLENLDLNNLTSTESNESVTSLTDSVKDVLSNRARHSKSIEDDARDCVARLSRKRKSSILPPNLSILKNNKPEIKNYERKTQVKKMAQSIDKHQPSLHNMLRAGIDQKVCDFSKVLDTAIYEGNIKIREDIENDHSRSSLTVLLPKQQQRPNISKKRTVEICAKLQDFTTGMKTSERSVSYIPNNQKHINMKSFPAKYQGLCGLHPKFLKASMAAQSNDDQKPLESKTHMDTHDINISGNVYPISELQWSESKLSNLKNDIPSINGTIDFDKSNKYEENNKFSVIIKGYDNINQSGHHRYSPFAAKHDTDKYNPHEDNKDYLYNKTLEHHNYIDRNVNNQGSLDTQLFHHTNPTHYEHSVNRNNELNYSTKYPPNLNTQLFHHTNPTHNEHSVNRNNELNYSKNYPPNLNTQLLHHTNPENYEHLVNNNELNYSKNYPPNLNTQLLHHTNPENYEHLVNNNELNYSTNYPPNLNTQLFQYNDLTTSNHHSERFGFSSQYFNESLSDNTRKEPVNYQSTELGLKNSSRKYRNKLKGIDSTNKSTHDSKRLNGVCISDTSTSDEDGSSTSRLLDKYYKSAVDEYHRIRAGEYLRKSGDKYLKKTGEKLILESAGEKLFSCLSDVDVKSHSQYHDPKYHRDMTSSVASSVIKANNECKRSSGFVATHEFDIQNHSLYNPSSQYCGSNVVKPTLLNNPETNLVNLNKSVNLNKDLDISQRATKTDYFYDIMSVNDPEVSLVSHETSTHSKQIRDIGCSPIGYVGNTTKKKIPMNMGVKPYSSYDYKAEPISQIYHPWNNSKEYITSQEKSFHSTNMLGSINPNHFESLLGQPDLKVNVERYKTPLEPVSELRILDNEHLIPCSPFERLLTAPDPSLVSAPINTRTNNKEPRGILKSSYSNIGQNDFSDISADNFIESDTEVYSSRSKLRVVFRGTPDPHSSAVTGVSSARANIYNVQQNTYGVQNMEDLKRNLVNVSPYSMSNSYDSDFTESKVFYEESRNNRYESTQTDSTNSASYFRDSQTLSSKRYNRLETYNQAQFLAPDINVIRPIHSSDSSTATNSIPSNYNSSDNLKYNMKNMSTPSATHEHYEYQGYSGTSDTSHSSEENLSFPRRKNTPYVHGYNAKDYRKDYMYDESRSVSSSSTTTNITRNSEPRNDYNFMTESSVLPNGPHRGKTSLPIMKINENPIEVSGNHNHLLYKDIEKSHNTTEDQIINNYSADQDKYFSDDKLKSVPYGTETFSSNLQNKDISSNRVTSNFQELFGRYPDLKKADKILNDSSITNINYTVKYKTQNCLEHLIKKAKETILLNYIDSNDKKNPYKEEIGKYNDKLCERNFRNVQKTYLSNVHSYRVLGSEPSALDLIPIVHAPEFSLDSISNSLRDTSLKISQNTDSSTSQEENCTEPKNLYSQRSQSSTDNDNYLNCSPQSVKDKDALAVRRLSNIINSERTSIINDMLSMSKDKQTSLEKNERKISKANEDFMPALRRNSILVEQNSSDIYHPEFYPIEPPPPLVLNNNNSDNENNRSGSCRNKKHSLSQRIQSSAREYFDKVFSRNSSRFSSVSRKSSKKRHSSLKDMILSNHQESTRPSQRRITLVTASGAHEIYDIDNTKRNSFRENVNLLREGSSSTKIRKSLQTPGDILESVSKNHVKKRFSMDPKPHIWSNLGEKRVNRKKCGQN